MQFLVARNFHDPRIAASLKGVPAAVFNLQEPLIAGSKPFCGGYESLRAYAFGSMWRQQV
jgi:hypothetical protein